MHHSLQSPRHTPPELTAAHDGHLTLAHVWCWLLPLDCDGAENEYLPPRHLSSDLASIVATAAARIPTVTRRQPETDADEGQDKHSENENENEKESEEDDDVDHDPTPRHPGAVAEAVTFDKPNFRQAPPLGIDWRHEMDDTWAPQVFRDTCLRIANVVDYAKPFIAPWLAQQPSGYRSPVFTDMRGNEEGQAEPPGRFPSPEQVGVIARETPKAHQKQISEDGWNNEVHSALLKMIFRDTTTTTYINSIHPVQPGAANNSCAIEIDSSIYTGAASAASTFASASMSINHTDHAKLRCSPICPSIETKRHDGLVQEAEVGLAVWMATQRNFLGDKLLLIADTASADAGMPRPDPKDAAVAFAAERGKGGKTQPRRGFGRVSLREILVPLRGCTKLYLLYGSLRDGVVLYIGRGPNGIFFWMG
ncbi:hypothetical protein MKZ38_003922 [Zalerion maritima]|uniref:PD-(D/E)XK nuclease-like domain-containing protein n=1 Tax=Zalerion maritima TaxID=339359 RepID=A0AAD5RTL7_9PEZI|nr:hypothetical protein MKZ38_003922 [Zalerion maritima]